MLWNEVDAFRLHWLLGTVLECGLHVGSQAMVREIACQGPQLTPLQQQVLTGLIHGLTRQGIVQAYALSESTVSRVIRRLEEIFEARNTMELVAKAARSGFWGELE